MPTLHFLPRACHLPLPGYLHLAYFATEISIHRRIVQSLDPSSADPYMLYICRSAAKTRLISAMDFVNRLKPEHLDSFWYFASTTNFALISTFGALLLATAPGHEEASFYESRLREYRWALSVSCKRAEWLESAVRILDSTQGMLAALPRKPEATGSVPLQQPSQMPIQLYHDDAAAQGMQMQMQFSPEEMEEGEGDQDSAYGGYEDVEFGMEFDDKFDGHDLE